MSTNIPTINVSLVEKCSSNSFNNNILNISVNENFNIDIIKNLLSTILSNKETISHIINADNICFMYNNNMLKVYQGNQLFDDNYILKLTRNDSIVFLENIINELNIYKNLNLL